ncbi:unnamed protein product [Linum tenue]|uniref:Glutathione S-transferase n=1 Tax=Linum tenue TaxID=586396 RepID=A0AAV0H7M4_9ROSI|nr:unnamed protein product [Linum tenue]
MCRRKSPCLSTAKTPAGVESLVILQYVHRRDMAFNSTPYLLPKHPYPRSQARFWAEFSDQKCVFRAWKAFWRPKGEEKDKAIEVSVERFEYLEKRIQGKTFFGSGEDGEEEENEKIGHLDLVLGWIQL